MKRLGLLMLFILAVNLLVLTPVVKASLWEPSDRVQEKRKTSYGSATFTVSLDSSPVNGNTLVMVVGTYRNSYVGTHVTAVTSTGAVWTRQVVADKNAAYISLEIWTATVGAGASDQILVTLNNLNVQAVCNVMEYSGAWSVDTYTSLDDQSTNPQTGTTGVTSVAQEIYVGGVMQQGTAADMSSPTNSFTLIDGTQYLPGSGTTTSVGVLEKIVTTPSASVASGVTVASSHSCGAIVILKPTTAPTSYAYTFSAKWENGTATTVSVDAVDSTTTETLSISGTSVTYYFAHQQTLFIWTTPDGANRYIYPTENTGTFTIYQPVGTTYIYEFTVRDYSKRLTGTNYVEVYVGTTLCVRAPIVSGNPTSFALDLGKVYNIKVLFGDDTSYEWGDFVAGSTLTKTINVLNIGWGDKAHLVSEFLTVEATRTASLISVFYEDNALGTTWVNVTISLINGTVVYSDQSNANTEYWTYACSSTEPYFVSVVGNNERLSEWGYSKKLDQTSWGFPATPNFGTLGWTFGGLSATMINNFIGGLVLLGVGGLFSFRWRKVAVLVIAAFASIFTWLGFTSYGYEFLLGLWVIAILAYLVLEAGD